jgi:hypothetical protein
MNRSAPGYRIENYEGFQIVWAVPPISQNMWPLELSTEDPNLWEKLLSYRKHYGVFATPVGPLNQALAAARKYIDAVWGQPG